MKKPSEMLEEERKMREKDEPSPPMARRKGLWRVLVIGIILAVIGLIIVVSSVG